MEIALVPALLRQACAAVWQLSSNPCKRRLLGLRTQMCALNAITSSSEPRKTRAATASRRRQSGAAHVAPTPQTGAGQRRHPLLQLMACSQALSYSQLANTATCVNQTLLALLVRPPGAGSRSTRGRTNLQPASCVPGVTQAGSPNLSDNQTGARSTKREDKAEQRGKAAWREMAADRPW